MNHTEIGNTNNKQPQGPPRGLLPARQPNEQLAVSDGTRIHCTAMRINQHQLFLAAFGPEQTKIVYTFVDTLRDYPGLQIRGVTTTRTEEGAGSYIMLGHIHGDARPLLDFGQKIQLNPWLEPVGAKVVPEAVIDLKIIAPARRQLLLDALTVISNDYGLNIESMIHCTLDNVLDHGFDLLRQGFRGGGDPPQGGETRAGGRLGQEGRGGLTLGGGPGDGGVGAIDGDLDLLGTADETLDLTVTKMRLELPQGTNLENLKHDLELVGKDWEFGWEQRRGKGVYDQKLTQRLFKALN